MTEKATKFLSLSLILLCLAPRVYSDTPAHCFIPDIAGEWVFKFGGRSSNGTCGFDISQDPNGYTSMKNMHQLPDESQIQTFELTLTPNRTLDGDIDSLIRQLNLSQDGPQDWDAMYDEGMVLKIRNLHMLAYFQYSPEVKNNDDTKSYCGRTYVGWYQINREKDLGCFIAERKGKAKDLVYAGKTPNRGKPVLTLEQKANIYKMKLLGKIKFDVRGLAKNSLQKRSQGTVFRNDTHLQKHRLSLLSKSLSISDLPQQFSWEKELPNVFNQKCGSCYAVSSAQVLSARAKIQFDVDIDVTHKDLLKCNFMSQGCDGGFAYEVYTYLSTHRTKSTACFQRDSRCGEYCGERGIRVKRWYRINGKSGYNPKSEENMMREILQRGPITVNFQSMDDLSMYSGGIYIPSDSDLAEYKKMCSPQKNFYAVSHSVMIFGWGVSDDGVKYWLVRNSWGTIFGENGNFRIIKGVNAVGIESWASAAEIELVEGD